MMFKNIVKLALAAVLFAGTFAAASETPVMDRVLGKKVLVVGTSGNMLPMTSRLKTGDVTGFDMDLAALMAGALGAELKVVVLPLDELAAAVQSGKVDVAISNMTATLERNKRVAFSEPYLQSGKCLVTKQKAMAAEDNPADLDMKEVKVAVLKGSTSEAFATVLMKHAGLMAVGTNDEGIALVKSGKADAMLSEYPMCAAAVANNPEAGFEATFSLLSYEPISIAMPGNDPLFMNWTDNFIKRLKATGTIDGLLQKWMGGGGL